jgi:monofunctional biosynthetic peptidoglycan transglycosylase
MRTSPLFWSDYRPDQPKQRTTKHKTAKRRPAQRPKAQRNRFRGWWWKIPVGLVAVNLLVLLLLRWLPPPTTAFMLQAKAPKSGLRYKWVPWKRISPYLPIAVVAAEDQKFPQHFGFDLESIGKAIHENQRRRRPRGASTITQQVAKNLFLWSGRSYLRKGLEAYLTVMIELTWPKRRILEVYLNIAQFGPGVFGVEAAGEAYFHRPASRLRRSDAAILAAVLPNPRMLKAAQPSAYVYERASEIREQMAQLGGPTYLKGVWPKP